MSAAAKKLRLSRLQLRWTGRSLAAPTAAEAVGATAKVGEAAAAAAAAARSSAFAVASSSRGSCAAGAATAPAAKAPAKVAAAKAAAGNPVAAAKDPGKPQQPKRRGRPPKVASAAKGESDDEGSDGGADGGAKQPQYPVTLRHKMLANAWHIKGGDRTLTVCTTEGYARFRMAGGIGQRALPLKAGEFRDYDPIEECPQFIRDSAEGRVRRAVIEAKDGTRRLETVGWAPRCSRKVLKAAIDGGAVGAPGMIILY